MLLEEEGPDFDSEGRFIAELDGKPVGTVHAHVDKLREEKKGFINDFCVIPEFRGRGVEEELAELAINELKTREMRIVQTWTDYERNDRVKLLEKHGFKPARSVSEMEISLAHIPPHLKKNTQVTIRPLRKNVEDDVKLLNRLDNECFKEHPNYRPSTIEETRHSLLNDTKFKEQEYFFATVANENVGYIGVGVDEKYNIEKNVKTGFILTIGVLKPYRRKCVGITLMLQGLETLKAKGMTKAMLDVNDFNPTKAHRLYEKVGFQIVKRYRICEKQL
jgi:mycothiol synthase